MRTWGRCELVETASGDLVVAAATYGHPERPRLHGVRYDARSWPPVLVGRGQRSLDAFTSIEGVAASPDGRRLAIFGEPAGTLVVLDVDGEALDSLAERRPVFERRFSGPLHAVELGPDGAGSPERGTSERAPTSSPRRGRGSASRTCR